MRFPILLLTLCLISGCGNDNNKSSGNGNEDPACNCVPDRTANSPEAINQMREKLANLWEDAHLKVGETEVTTLAPNELELEFGSGNEAYVCHYVYEKLVYEVTRTDDGSPPDGDTYEIYRNMGPYTLGNETTGSREDCDDHASEEDPTALIGAQLQNTLFLYLEQIGTIEAHPHRSIISNSSGTAPDVKPSRMIEHKKLNLTVYTLVYDVTYSNEDGTFNGEVIVHFTSEFFVFGNVWSVRNRGKYNGIPINESLPITLKVNDLNIPQL